jgi:surfeit locus 1 family protein
LARNLWFSRDIAPIAAHLGAEPVLIVARADLPGPAGLITQPIDSHGLKNDHLGYAITWFLLAAVWAGMTAFLMWRIRQAKV